VVSPRRFLLVVLGFAFLGWLHGTQLFVGIASEVPERQFSYGRFVFWQVACWLTWALLTPLVVYISRRRSVLLHLVACVTLPLTHILAIYVINQTVLPFGRPPGPPRSFASMYMSLFGLNFHIDLVIYWGIVGAVTALDTQRRLRERELHASRVETQLAQAQLTNLRLQLQPHFLFNTLHVIASLVRDGDSKSAVKMIAGLSDLLRYSLDNAGCNLVTLSEEVDVVQRYLEIQQTRFSDRLTVGISIDDDARHAAVPTLLLQPLVENAIRHGIADPTRGGRLELSARRRDGTLVVEIFNDGPALPEDWEQRIGVGLGSTRSRLAQLYGDAAALEMENRTPGVVARVRIPYAECADV